MMEKSPLARRGIPASRLVLGCMGFAGDDWFDRSPITSSHVKIGHEAVEAALSSGINMFDHANIYKQGRAEQVFGQVLKERKASREDIFIQSKCGIRLGETPNQSPRYDFSKTHILESVDGILTRLGVEYIDFLLLHRPDALVDPEELASAFADLRGTGKVRWFGVSNMSTGQIRLLQSYVSEPIVVNQLEMSLAKIGWLETGVHVNQPAARDNVFPEGTLEHCRLENIQIQAWGPLAQGIFSGRSLDGQSDAIRATANLVDKLATEKQTTREAIVLAWLMRHPAAIQPVIGTANPARIAACAGAYQVNLSREEWYDLYISSRGRKLP